MTCPYCHGKGPASQSFLGDLGNRRHYRCRFCGGQWSRERTARGWKSPVKRRGAEGQSPSATSGDCSAKPAG